MVYFQTQNPNLGKFWRALYWKMFTYFMAIWNILWTFGKFYGHLGNFMVIWEILWSFGIFYVHLVHFMFIWYIFAGFGIKDHEKSGNPGPCAL
jgi:hypothetical protein